jgi:hypothetical protein
LSLQPKTRAVSNAPKKTRTALRWIMGGLHVFCLSTRSRLPAVCT